MSLLTAVLAGSQPSPPALLPAPLRAHLQAERFGIVTSIRGLPLGVRDRLQALFGSATLDIAEPGAPLRATDGNDAATLSIRRLVAAGCSIDHCLVHYERGGGAHTWPVALFYWTPDETRLEWGGLAPRGLTAIDDVRTAVLSGAIKGPVTFW